MLTRCIVSVSKKNPAILPLSLALAAALPYAVEFADTGSLHISYQIAFGFFWLVVSPVLIWYGYRSLEWFLEYLKDFIDPDAHAALSEKTFSDIFSSRHLYFSFPLLFVFTFFAKLYAGHAGLAPVLQWAVVVLFALSGFMAGIGFWGIWVMEKLIRRMCGLDLKLDPFCIDGYGGLLYVGRFLVIGSALYFSGSMYIPFATEVFDMFSKENSVIIAYISVFAYIAFGLGMYFRSILYVHDKLLAEKMRIDDDSQEVLYRLQEGVMNGNDTPSLEQVVRPYVYYVVHHSRINGMRTFPYDTKSLIEIIATVMIPVLIFTFEQLFRG
ncbi:hypothetical protein [Pseudodesulfovibrio portus]|uniref:Uncharacterized protein n=1 Tax=Pseudodesulfovibrio portus TaxID=231439 RepID=A0ABM8ATI5_9BACT|nr:hypothetical protein [Pseudodesulfovibrio portus]BDQ34619.1 hypothetical protein JCM14722_21610 [Pseudodesulfovibrio portus]